MRAVAFVILACAAGWAAPARAQEAAPLTLAGAVSEALRHSPRLPPAEDGVALAEIAERVARSAFDLKVTPALAFETGAAGLGQERVGLDVSKRLAFGTDVSVRVDSTRYGSLFRDVRDTGYAVSITQPLLRGFGPGVTAPVAEAERRVAGAARAREDARQQLVVEVAEAFYAVGRHARLVEASRQTLDRAKALGAQSAARTSVGLATELDVLRADLLMSQSEAQLDAQREALAAAEDRLALLIGRPIGVPIALAAEPPASPPEVVPTDDADIARMVAEALRRRVDVLEAVDRVDDARRQARIARWDLLPDVALQASYAQRGLGSPAASVLQDMLGGWRVGLVTRYGTDRAAQTAAVQTAGIGERAALRALDDVQRRVEAEVRQAHRARARAASAVAIQTKAVALARRQQRLAELRYRTGVAGNFDVIDAEHARFQAETALASAEVDRAMAELVLLRVTGRLNPEALP